jgi:hypothetical protein
MYSTQTDIHSRSSIKANDGTAHHWVSEAREEAVGKGCDHGPSVALVNPLQHSVNGLGLCRQHGWPLVGRVSQLTANSSKDLLVLERALSAGLTGQSW